MPATAPAADTLRTVNNRSPNIDFIARAIEFNVDVTETIMPFVDWSSFNIALNNREFKSNIG